MAYHSQHLIQMANLSKYLTRVRINREFTLQLACNEFMNILFNALYTYPFFQSDQWRTLLSSHTQIEYPTSLSNEPDPLTKFKQAKNLETLLRELSEKFQDSSSYAIKTLEKTDEKTRCADQYIDMFSECSTSLSLCVATIMVGDIVKAWEIVFITLQSSFDN